VFVVRGSRTERVPHGFVSDATLSAIVSRLAALCGATVTDGPVQEGRLPDGTHMLVLRPPLVSEGTVLVFDRPVKSALNPDDLVAAGMMDEATLRLLRNGLRAHRNLMVCGGPHAGMTVFLNAILKLVPSEDRVLVVEGRRELALTQQNVVCLSREGLANSGKGGLCILPRLYPDIVVVPDLEGSGAETLVRLAIAGQSGLVSSMVAGSAESCLRRFELLVSLANAGLAPEVVHQAVRHALDIVVVLGAGEDGRSRVVEVAEMDPDRGILKFIEPGG
jgi:pilus assembly protein CpaF